MSAFYLQVLFDLPIKKSWVYSPPVLEAPVEPLKTGRKKKGAAGTPGLLAEEAENHTKNIAPDSGGREAPVNAGGFLGKRVIAPFGRRELAGFITGVLTELPAGVESGKIKAVKRVIDKEPIFGTEEIENAIWMSDYYFCSQGEALAAMIPCGRRGGGFSSFSEEDLDRNLQESAISLSGEQEAALNEINAALRDKKSGGSGTDRSASGAKREDCEAWGSSVKEAGVLAEASNFLGGESAPPLKKTQKNWFYLFGSTGSGKTEVFLRAAKETLDLGKSVIYLVPEIALTRQSAVALGERFGSKAAMLHSGMTAGERISEWMRIKKGEARIVLGPRGAVFAPLRDLGLVIIDEEHDGSYKSSNTPRYHARQIAMRRAGTHGAVLLLGSATPSAEAWSLMKKGGIRRLTLTRRLAGGAAPEVKIVSLEESRGCLTRELKNEILKTAQLKRQTILFLNRRGFAYFYRCPSCGFELTCKRCSVSLTWHKTKGYAECHYCGFRAAPPSACPKCGSLEAGFTGFGTEMIEEELKNTFPNLHIRRLDADAAAKKGVLETTLSEFRAGLIDILLGTQMVAKGLNFPGVRLVGVVFADTGLHMPDFRAAERTFSLLVQVSGRAGRFFPDGKVLVQTLRPGDPSIVKACAGDVEGFFDAELKARKLMGFPPATRIIRWVLRSPDEARVNAEINRLYRCIAPRMPKNADILGPAECPLSMINGARRRHITIRGEKASTLHAAARLATEDFSREADHKVYMEIDVDPVNLL
ncbi:MAG: primosomal protein N' [Spirochaetaceae bacterium]|jgi:primosomal protein N' (replication factor Y)|nr:primosomal protein N' [Spirochaetaceae bacterium]